LEVDVVTKYVTRSNTPPFESDAFSRMLSEMFSQVRIEICGVFFISIELHLAPETDLFDKLPKSARHGL
jgi:hypothetical protein